MSNSWSLPFLQLRKISVRRYFILCILPLPVALALISARFAIGQEKTKEGNSAKPDQTKVEKTKKAKQENRNGETPPIPGKLKLRDKGKVVEGELALEIVGEDLHGKKFRLSDYAGKVILIDYWGHW